MLRRAPLVYVLAAALACVLVAALVVAGPAVAQTARDAGPDTAPLSAIDWLTRNAPEDAPHPALTPPALREPPTARSGTAPDVSVTPLGAQTGRRLGLLPGAVTGLPPQLWRGAEAEALIEALRGATGQRIAAAQELLVMLLLAESDDLPARAQASDWLRARLSVLLDLGAIEPALAFLRQAEPARSPDLFALWFDLSLLAGEEDAPCAALIAGPHLAPGQAALIYCTARQGDVDTAALLYGTAAALGLLNSVQEPLLARFLDPDLFEDTALPRAPVRPDPLTFRLYAAAGAPLPTLPLPRAFAHADLRADAGWKAQLEAAERLARAGVLPSNQLLGLYTERRAAASGGIWDRVAALQAFETALQAGDQARLSAALPPMWRGMQSAGLEVVFSDLFADALAAQSLPGRAGEIAYFMELVSRSYETAPLPEGASDRLRFLASVAQGAPDPALASSAMARAVAGAFGPDAAPSERLRTLGPEDVGLALLEVLRLTAAAGRGDVAALGQALSDLRVVGLEDFARRTALQALILLDRE